MRRTLLAKTAGLAVPLLLALAVVLLAGLSVERQIESFQPLGVRAASEGGPLRVTEAAPGTGLEAGDRIYLVNGAQVASGRELRERLVGQPASELTVHRGGDVVLARYVRPPLDVDFPYLILALIGVTYLLIGLYTVVKHGRAQGRIFYLWCLASAAVYLLTKPPPPFGAADKAIVVADGLALALLAPLTLHLFLVFPRPLLRRETLRRLVPFLYLPAAVAAALHLDLALFGGRFLFGPPTAASVQTFEAAVRYHLIVFLVLALAAHALRLRGELEFEERRQIRWIAVGLCVGYVPYLLFAAVPLALRLDWPELVTSAAVVPLGLVPLTFAYAILRYKLWDIEVIVRDTISLTLTLLLGVVGFSLVNLAISRGVPADMALARNLLSFATGIAIAGLVMPTRRSIGSALDRIQYRGSFGKRRALAELGRELLHERDLDHLCADLLDRLQDAMELEAVNLYLAQGDDLLPVRPHPGLPARLPLGVLGEEAWERELVSIPATALPGRLPPPAQRLFMAGYRYAFPLVVRDHHVGLAVTSYKAEETPLNSDDVELIRQLLNQAALAIENAQLLDQLHHQLAEVLRLQRFSQGIVESSPAGIAVLDADGRVLSANLGFAALVGRERREVVGEPIGEVLRVELPAPGEGLAEASFRPGSGEERYLQLSVAQLAAGGSEQRILMVQDVSERVAMANELKEKDRLAALGMLAAGVAHEVNTPITGISSYAQLLLDETPEDDPRHRLLKKVERQTFRAARIVSNLLEFARDRHGERRPLSLEPVVTEALEMLRERLEERGIEVEWRPPADGVRVLGSESELQQVFTNLLVNAIDAMADGGRLTVEVDVDESWVRAAVEDTGPGIPQERLEKIFQPFFSTKLAQGGTGLGLSISYEIVRRHGGEMRVVSHPGEGSRFLVELPRHRQEAP